MEGGSGCETEFPTIVNCYRQVESLELLKLYFPYQEVNKLLTKQEGRFTNGRGEKVGPIVMGTHLVLP